MLIQEIDILRDEYISTCKLLLSISINCGTSGGMVHLSGT